MTHATSAFNQTHFRWRNDDGDETSLGATWAHGEDAADFAPVVESDGTYQCRLRIQVEETANASTGGGVEYGFEYNVDGAGWNAVPGAGTASVPVRYYNSTNLTGGNVTTGPQLTQPGGTTWQDGYQIEASADETSSTVSGLDVTEMEAALEFVGSELTGVSEIQFRLVYNAIALEAYGVTVDVDPILAVVKTASATGAGTSAVAKAAPNRIKVASATGAGTSAVAKAAPIRVRLSQGHISVGAFG
jgi:hypothetical protein